MKKISVEMTKLLWSAGAATGFFEGGGDQGGGGDRGWSPLSAKNYYLNTQNFQLQGGGVITPTTPPPCIRHWSDITIDTCCMYM